MPLPRHLTLHRTAHPKIVFAGGDLFGFESLSRIDGLLAFAERGAFGQDARDAISQGRIQCPYRVHYYSLSPQAITDFVHEDLDSLVEEGCQRIGIHAPSDVPKAQIALQAAVDWLGVHARNIDKLYFIDAHDDYYNCFGLDSFKKSRRVCNMSPTEFETYYEHEFVREMEETFSRYATSGGIRTYLISKDDAILWTLPISFSIGLYFTVLIPQVVAKVTGNLQDTYDFLKVSKMPAINRLMAGFMDPYYILSDTGLLPKDEEEITTWLHLAKEETDYFFRVMTHHIIGGIQTPATASAKRLYRLNGQQIKAMRQEMKENLKRLEACLKGGPAPAIYILSDEILRQDERTRF